MKQKTRMRCGECWAAEDQNPIFINSITGKCQPECPKGKQGLHPFAAYIGEVSQAYCYDCDISSCSYCFSDSEVKYNFSRCMQGINMKGFDIDCESYKEVVNNISPLCRRKNLKQEGKNKKRSIEDFFWELASPMMMMAAITAYFMFNLINSNLIINAIGKNLILNVIIRC